MKVGYIVPTLDDSTGWGRWANDFLRHVTNYDVEPIVFCPHSSERHYRTNYTTSKTFFVLPEHFDSIQSMTGLTTFRFPKRIFRDIPLPSDVDLIHSFEAFPWGVYGNFLAKRLQVPHIMTTHGRYGYVAAKKTVDRFFYRQILRNVSVICPVSNAVKNRIIRNFKNTINDDVFHTIYNAVDAKRFPNAGGLTRGKSPDRKIISVTRFVRVKDIETAVTAFEIVKRQVPDATYDIIGPGTGPRNVYFQEIKSLVETSKINGVRFLGRIDPDELAKFYSSASVLLHTARELKDDFEAYGLIFLEAGLFRLPVVASRTGGVPECVVDGVTGILAEEASPRNHAAALVSILNDNELAKRLGDNNHKMANARTWESYLAEQLRVYRTALGDYHDDHS